MADPIMTINNLNFYYHGDVHALKKLSLQVCRNQVTL
jgi:ABC-type phosphate transport system ATPase subunit